MKPFAKKFLSIALAAVLLLGVLPMAAFAEDAAASDPTAAEVQQTETQQTETQQTEPQQTETQQTEPQQTETQQTEPQQTEAPSVPKVDAEGDVAPSAPEADAPHTHKFDIKKSNPSTCSKQGIEWMECACGEKDMTSVKTLPLADHNWGAWKEIKAPTSSTEGIEERTCADCGKTESRAIAKDEAPIKYWKITFDEAYPSPYNNGAVTTYEIKEGQRVGSLFKKGLPIPACNLHVFKGWYLTNPDGSDTNIKVTSETMFDFDRNVTVKAKWAREARVNLMIYRNGNTSTPYDVVPLWGYAVGDVINTKDLKISHYYKNGGKPFDFDGWYDRGGWTLYKAQDNPKPVSAIETVDLNGDTTLFCMVHDSNAPASNKNPDRTNPKTGDESMIIASTAVMLVSAGALAVFFMDRKRRNG